MRDELIQVMQEAERRGDMETAKAALLKIESLEQPQSEINQPAAQEPQELPEGTAMDAITEPALATVGGLAGQAASGLKGLYTLATEGLDAAVDDINETQDIVGEAVAPQTQAGQEGLETLGDVVEKGVDLAQIPLSGLTGIGELITGQGLEQATETIKSVQDEGFGKTVGSRVLSETDSPLAATMAEISPEIFSSFFVVGKMAGRNKALNKSLAKQIQLGGTDKKLAKYIVDGAGKVRNDPLYKPLVRTGFDQGAIAAFKGSSPTDKSKLLQMLEVKRKGKSNALYAVKNRPSDVAGDSLLERINYIKKINSESAKNVSKQANALKGVNVDFSKPINKFINDLDEMGIELGNNLKPIFKGSDIEGATAAENAVKRVVKRLSSGDLGKTPDAYDLHRVKKYIDEIVTYGKNGEGLAGKTERILKKLRANVDKTLDKNFPEYNKANTIYSETIGTLDAIQDVAGKKMDLSGINANKATGTLLRRLMSNAQSRVNLVDAVNKLEDVSKKYGANFSDDITTQMMFADELDAVFGTSARTSLAGEVGKSVQQGIDAATGGKSALSKAKEAAGNVVKTGVKKALGTDEDKAFKMMKEMLERTPSAWEK